FYQGLLTLSGVKIRVQGKENIPDSRSCIFVANHASYYDIPSAMIGLGTNRLRIVYKKELERIPIFGWAMKWTGMYIGINRGRGIE
ncbi:1-acyl-sn-glycerol-3-phosphate acyltransferase, partial [Enterococcus faecalis]|uniref:lysophospholipid acyltransferase family protein n=1 Tax=Enterococcus faecalis TaxID=1351 RepID=UPI0021B0AABC